MTLLSLLLFIGAYFFILTNALERIPRSYIVEYEEDSDNHHHIIKRELESSNALYNVHHTYTSSLFRGMSISLINEEDSTNPLSKREADRRHPVIEKLQNHPHVKKVYPMHTIPRPQSIRAPSGVSYPYDDQLSQLKLVHEKLGVTGKGVVVGILDSGIDYNHPALGEGFGDGFKVKFGANLVDPEKDKKYGVEPRGPDDPFDPCTDANAGHGTHVAGIISGYYPEKNFTGVAPNATLGIWRIFSCEEGANENTVIKGLEQAYDAGCNIINLSLGVEKSWPENAMAVVADRLSRKGVIVIGVAGNQGSDGVYSQNAPSSGKHSVSVASVDSISYPTKVFESKAIPEKKFRFTFSETTSEFPNGTMVPVYDNNNYDDISDGCQALSSTTAYKNKILLVKRGECTFVEKLKNARKVGAIGVVFYETDPSVKAITVADTKEQKNIPMLGIDNDDGLELKEYFKAKRTSIEIVFPLKMVTYELETGGTLSEFSSIGPTYELDLKPTVAGIGGEVYSTVPLAVDDGWGVKTGTSMASPHVAGVSALMIEHYRRTNASLANGQFIVEHLQNHAKLVKLMGRPDHPLAQGAGLVQPYDAMTSQFHVSPGQLSFNDTSKDENRKQSIVLHNSNSYDVYINIKNVPSRSIQTFENVTSFTPNEPSWRNGSITVDLELSQKKVFLSAYTSQAIDITALLPDPKQVRYHYQMYGGYVSIENLNTRKTLATVPYFGVLGKMRDLPVLDKGYPYLALASNTSEKWDGGRFVYKISDSDTKPAIVIRLLTGSAKIKVEVYDKSNRFVGLMDTVGTRTWAFNERNTLTDKFSELKWNGKVKTASSSNSDATDKEDTIEDGDYYFNLKVLKQFGDPNSPHDWEEWKSELITVES
ncbi:subtilisin-like protein [Backusella circina FSU 941]|nr:subtilisin-like protein [Backusella circina FSU 941]